MFCLPWAPTVQVEGARRYMSVCEPRLHCQPATLSLVCTSHSKLHRKLLAACCSDLWVKSFLLFLDLIGWISYTCTIVRSVALSIFQRYCGSTCVGMNCNWNLSCSVMLLVRLSVVDTCAFLTYFSHFRNCNFSQRIWLHIIIHLCIGFIGVDTLGLIFLLFWLDEKVFPTNRSSFLWIFNWGSACITDITGYALFSTSLWYRIFPFFALNMEVQCVYFLCIVKIQM